MRQNHLLNLALIVCSLSACKKPAPAPEVNVGLAGQWAGDYQTQQAGSCTWSGPAITATATFRVVNNTVTATVTQTAGTTSVPADYSGILDGNTVRLSKSNNAICNGVSRVYTNQFEGTINGNTLALISRDTVCPAQGCIFLRTLKLTRQ